MRATTAGWKSKSVFLNIISSSHMSKEDYGTVSAKFENDKPLGLEQVVHSSAIVQRLSTMPSVRTLL